MSQLSPKQIEIITAYYEKNVDAGPIPDHALQKAIGHKLKLSTAQNTYFNGHMSQARKKGFFPNFTVRYGQNGGTVRATPEEIQAKKDMENVTSTMLAQVEKDVLSSSMVMHGMGAISTGLPEPTHHSSTSLALHTLYAETASIMLDMNALVARFNASQARILELLQKA